MKILLISVSLLALGGCFERETPAEREARIDKACRHPILETVEECKLRLISEEYAELIAERNAQTRRH